MAARPVLTVAVTGGIGSGKSEVVHLLRGLGAVVVDADALAREVLEPGSTTLGVVVAEFGSAVLKADGSLNRPALAAVVFADDNARRRLEALVHPEVARRSRAAIAAAPAGSVVAYEIPLLAETGRADEFDMVVVVDVPPELQRARLRERGLTDVDIAARMSAQAGRENRLRLADIVVDNSGTRDQLRARVTEVWKKICRDL